MLIDFTELEELIDRIGETKIQILESCLTPKHWSELIDITKKSEPTLLVHVNDLMKMRLLEKNQNERTYLTSEKGVEFLRLKPHVRPMPEKGKRPYEQIKMVQRGIKLEHLSFKEKIEFDFLGLAGFDVDKTLEKMYTDVIAAIRQSVTLWLPKEFEPDKAMYKEVNQLIGQYTKRHSDPKDGKISMIIEFDIATALDKIIREEKEDKVRQRLDENRESILKSIYKNWYRIFK